MSESTIQALIDTEGFDPRIARAFVTDDDFSDRYRSLYQDAISVLAEAIRQSGFRIESAPFVGPGALTEDEQLVQRFNETPGRTQADVLEVFDAALASV